MNPTLLQSKPKQLAFHNLCLHTKLPPTLKSLLGMGLNFSIQPKTSTPSKFIQLDRLQKDLFRRFMFANAPPIDKSDLYLPNETWEPQAPNSEELLQRSQKSINKIKAIFDKREKRKYDSNLLCFQESAIRWLLLHPEVMVLNCDKNLGPCVMERTRYLEFAWLNHLSDDRTYKLLTAYESREKIENVRILIDYFCHTFSSINKKDLDYIKRYTDSVTDSNAPSHMYLLPKIHKTPLKTRAIISYSGSICQGIAQWIDTQLKKILIHIPYIAKSAEGVVRDVTEKQWDASSLMFTMDAVSMYTNIHLGHALPIFEKFLTTSDLGRSIKQAENINENALLCGLKIVMENNIFQFGDSNWLQIAGTAMGTPPAPRWATLYFAIWELEVIPKYAEISFYNRYIDDGFGIWTPIQSNDTKRFEDFKIDFARFGEKHPFFLDSNYEPMKWEFEKRSKQATFLDINLTLHSTGLVETSLHEKQLNLHLYLPPHSCHSPGVIKGLIYGMIHRTKKLCSNPHSYMPHLQRFYIRLLARGYQRSMIKPIFSSALSSIMNPTQTCVTSTPLVLDPVFLHLPFNNNDPSSKTLQTIFRSNLLHPEGKPMITSIPTNNTFNGNVDFDQVIICYNKQKSLKNVLAPRKIRCQDGFSVKAFLDSLT